MNAPQCYTYIASFVNVILSRTKHCRTGGITGSDVMHSVALSHDLPLTLMEAFMEFLFHDSVEHCL